MKDGDINKMLGSEENPIMVNMENQDLTEENVAKIFKGHIEAVKGIHKHTPIAHIQVCKNICPNQHGGGQ